MGVIRGTKTFALRMTIGAAEVSKWVKGSAHGAGAGADSSLYTKHIDYTDGAGSGAGAGADAAGCRYMFCVRRKVCANSSSNASSVCGGLNRFGKVVTSLWWDGKIVKCIRDDTLAGATEETRESADLLLT